MSQRFAFGRNWQRYTEGVTPEKLSFAISSLLKLVTQDEIKDSAVLDIGSGSGIHSASFLELGACHVTSIDYDVNSVEATKKLLAAFKATQYEVFQADILDQSTMPTKTFDIVYSWGVLHHTGDMKAAIKNACQFVKPGGLLVVALYRKTPLCKFWKFEKRTYSNSPEFLQSWILRIYSTLFSSVLLIKHRQPIDSYRKSYKLQRGMELEIDFHDWLGGYPYESITPMEYRNLIEPDFSIIRMFTQSGGLGVLGSGCDEFVHKRNQEEFST